jgi:hypothetical protein
VDNVASAGTVLLQQVSIIIATNFSLVFVVINIVIINIVAILIIFCMLVSARCATLELHVLT